MRRRIAFISALIAMTALTGAPSSASASIGRLTTARTRALSSIYKALFATADRHASAPSAREAIVGGAAADQQHYAYAAFIVWFDADGSPQYACSGTVISANVVLTAAHCVLDETTRQPLAADGFRVVTGVADWSDESNRQVSDVSQALANPNYDDVTDAADAALLVLTEPSTAPPVRLAANSERYLYTPGMPAVVAGWGLDDSGTLGTVLRSATTDVQDAGYCAQFDDLFDGHWQTCAIQAPGYFSGVCSGDSGGPLLTFDAENRPVQIGVIDMGPKDCTDTALPGYYARGDQLLGWASSVASSVAQPGIASMPATPTDPVAPTLTDADARSYAQAMVQRRTHTRSRLSLDCGRISAWKLRCQLSFRASGSAYTANGTFWHVLNGQTPSRSYDFRGTITKRACAGRRCRTARQRFRWR